MITSISKRFSTIGMKLIFVVIVICALELGGLSAYNAMNEQHALSADLKALATITTQRLINHLSDPMWDLDKDLVDAIIRAEMIEGKIQAIAVWDVRTGRIFIARERSPNGDLIKSTGVIKGDLIKAIGKVNNGIKDIGEVAVFVSKKELEHKLLRSMLQGALTVLVLILIMAVLVKVAMNQMIVEPIKELAKHADDISQGDLKQNITVESNDEIGQLAEAFRRMQMSLRFSFIQLHAKVNTPN